MKQEKGIEDQSRVNQELEALVSSRKRILSALAAIEDYPASHIMVSRGDGLPPAIVSSVRFTGFKNEDNKYIENVIHESIRGAVVRANRDALEEVNNRIWDLSQQLKK